MQVEKRKAAIAAYKKRERAVGIYAVRCVPADALWIGQSTNLGTIWNRIAFTLEHGSHTSRTLQAAWCAHAPAAFSFAVLEQVEDEESPYLLNAALKALCASWRDRLGAEAI